MQRNCEGLNYELIRKMGQRSIRITVRHGTVSVSAGISQPQSKIDEFVSSKKSWIEAHLQPQGGSAAIDWENGSTVYLLGQPYTLILTAASRGKVTVQDNQLIIAGPSLTAQKQAWQRYCHQQLAELIKEFSALLTDDPGPYELGYRDMISRWGSCMVAKRRITISTRCLSLPKEGIRFVYVHELAHLQQANHQKAFYRRMGQLWPDYQMGRQAVKQFTM
jgi:predicted metal-dependent hydrolase